MTKETLAPWYSDKRKAWEAEVRAWLVKTGEARALGQLRAMTPIKERPWSLVRRVRFEKGDFIFKACGAAGAHEPALLLFLASQEALPVTVVVAANRQRGWLLLQDAGEPLREVRRGIEEVKTFSALLPRYAEMQMASLSAGQRLLALGLPDRRLQRLPQLLERLLSLEARAVGQSDRDWDALRASLRAQRAKLQDVCRGLGSSAYAAALDHGDLHQANVFVQANEIRLGDWGDACITHPFCSALVTLETTVSHVPQEDRETWAATLRDAYLEPWERIGPRDALQRDFERAMWLAHLLRALNFAHMFQGAEEAALDRWRPMIAERLQMWLRHPIPAH